jgi:hypothetical protein
LGSRFLAPPHSKSSGHSASFKAWRRERWTRVPKVILLVWHEVDAHYIAGRAPILADRLGALTSEGIEDVADKREA